MSMDPERLAELRRVARLPVPGTSMAGCLNVHADHVRDLLADHDDLAREVERLREDSRIQGVILGDVGEALGSGVEESPVDAARCMRDGAERLRGELDDAERRAAMACEAADPLCPCDGCKLAAETGAPEGEQPRHDGECRVKLGPSRDGWVCSKGTLGCIGEQP